jgi:hypothetical protein
MHWYGDNTLNSIARAGRGISGNSVLNNDDDDDDDDDDNNNNCNLSFLLRIAYR